MMTAQQLNLLKGLIDFHRNHFAYADSEDDIDYDKENWKEYRYLKGWLINNSFITADDDMLDMLKELSE